MQALSNEMSVFERGIEALISFSKLYIKNRQEEEFDEISKNVQTLKTELERVYENEMSIAGSSKIFKLKIFSNVVSKFGESLSLLDEIKNLKPLCKELDTRYMLDILLKNIKVLINYKNEKGLIESEKLKADLELVKSLRDQHRRILMTYLMQDWQNLNEVLILLRISEIYNSIAEELIDIFLLTGFEE